MGGVFTARRAMRCGALSDPGFRCSMPGGAFLCVAHMSGTGMPFEGVADSCFMKRAACLPGAVWDAGGGGSVSLCELLGEFERSGGGADHLDR